MDALRSPLSPSGGPSLWAARKAAAMIPQPPGPCQPASPDFLSADSEFRAAGHSVYCPTVARKRTLAIGLTGGIGTGKSRVAELLQELGAALECSDQIVREIQAPGGAALAGIIATFGDEYLLPSGELDRVRLGELVFRNPEARAKLGTLIHPLVYRELAERLEAHRRQGKPVVVLDIPLLLEGPKDWWRSGTLLPLDLIVLVYADEETQVERIRTRDQLSRGEALARIRAQLSIEEKRALADVVIDNSGSWESTAERVREQYAEWISGEEPSARPR